MQTDTHKALCKLLQGDYRSESSIQLVKRVEGLVKALRTERDELVTFGEELADHLELFGEELADHLELPTIRFSGDVYQAIETLRTERDTLRKERDALSTNLRTLGDKFYTLETQRNELLAAQPQLSEIRYVLHGDIQPCSVLYSDDTTTLLRLDEGDMMLETDTIEWSDSVTYRCQELLRVSALNKINLVRVSGHLAQLVRDERILLVDESPVDSDEEFLRSAITPAPAPMVVPAAPAAPARPSCGNPYVHDIGSYPEADMRAAGWQTEDLVQNGYGHYAPVPCAPTTEQQPQER